MNTERLFSTGELCELAGVSRRTLQYYDKVALLKPARRKDNGYREYTEKHAVMLQQILIFRELDFGIDEIKKLLHAKDYNLFIALQSQKTLLLEKQKKADSMIASLDSTMQAMAENVHRNLDLIYAGIPKEKAERWEKLATDRVGEEQRLIDLQAIGQMSEKEAKTFSEQGHIFFGAYADLLAEPIDSPAVQAQVKRYYDFTNELYKNSVDGFEGITYEGFTNLAHMSVEYPEMRESYEHYGAGMAEHMSEAMMVFAEQNLR